MTNGKSVLVGKKLTGKNQSNFRKGTPGCKGAANLIIWNANIRPRKGRAIEGRKGGIIESRSHQASFSNKRVVFVGGGSPWYFPHEVGWS